MSVRTFLRFFVSFQFLSACALLLFSLALYFVIKSLFAEPDYFRETVWEDQFNKANFDKEFLTPSDSYKVDLSLWMPVQDKLRAAHVSAVRQTVRRQIVRRPEQREYLLALHTSGLKPDFTCLTHPFTFTKDYGLEKPAGTENLSRFTARVDISKEPAGKPIDIEFIIYSWNAFQGEENQMFGAYAKPGTKTLSFRVLMPDRLEQFALGFERFDSASDTTQVLDQRQIHYQAVSNTEFAIFIEEPTAGDGYFIRWRKLRSRR